MGVHERDARPSGLWSLPTPRRCRERHRHLLPQRRRDLCGALHFFPLLSSSCGQHCATPACSCAGGTNAQPGHVSQGNLDFRLTATDVDVAFSQFGTVTRVRLPSGDVAGENRGFAFVHYQDSRSCILACNNMDGCDHRSALRPLLLSPIGSCVY